MELNLARDVKNNKKGFYRYIYQKRLSKESVTPLINEKGKLTITDMEMAEVLKFFASVFSGSQASRISHILEPLGRSQESKIPSTVRVEKV